MFVCLFVVSSLFWRHEKLVSRQLRQDHIYRNIIYIFFFWGGGGEITNAVQSEGENYPTLNSETTRNLYNGLLGATVFL